MRMQPFVISSTLILLMASSTAMAQNGAQYVPWLLGCWESTDRDPVEIERWVAGNNSLNGTRTTIRNGAQHVMETLTIHRNASDVVVLTAAPTGQPTADFYLVEINADEVVFENREHDFPQRIIYRLLPGFKLLGRIEGVVDGQAKAADFHMSRIDCD